MQFSGCRFVIKQETVATDAGGKPELDSATTIQIGDLLPYGIGCSGIEDASEFAHPMLFVDPDGGDPSIQSGSPCIDAADDSAAPATDMVGNVRVEVDNLGAEGTVADLGAICSAPRKAGAILAVDNTFATPLNQRPLELGADVSMHSATKFIGGHSDLLGGLLITGHSELLEGFRESRTLGGATPGALEAFLAVRGLRTLAVRLEKAQENAARLAQWLDSHEAVERVRYPGL